MLLILSTCFTHLFGQLTVSGASHGSVNSNYTLTTSSPPHYIVDAGTNKYRYSYQQQDFHHFFYIVRINNKWTLLTDSYYTDFGGGVWYYALNIDQNTSTDIDPPCTGIFDSYSGVYPNSQLIGVDNIIMTGATCIVQPVTSMASIISPFGISLPQMTTTQINAQANPTAGTVVWNSTLACLYVFNGTTWVCNN
ncbi:hypothetical protein SAMN06298216_2126 [Spirosomataceae bacterium TFI 002]|nr:hypothetical protein SAMN06298216_2126 [Spirosomataceae bacterium TFI 002]